jgi:hypothetical protein
LQAYNDGVYIMKMSSSREIVTEGEIGMDEGGEEGKAAVGIDIIYLLALRYEAIHSISFKFSLFIEIGFTTTTGAIRLPSHTISARKL